MTIYEWVAKQITDYFRGAGYKSGNLMVDALTVSSALSNVIINETTVNSFEQILALRIEEKLKEHTVYLGRDYNTTGIIIDAAKEAGMFRDSNRPNWRLSMSLEAFVPGKTRYEVRQRGGVIEVWFQSPGEYKKIEPDLS